MHPPGFPDRLAPASRRSLWTLARFAAAALALLGAREASAAVIAPLEFRQLETPYNFQSARGVPIFHGPGSDGRMPAPTDNASGSSLPATTNQFKGFVSFGAAAASHAQFGDTNLNSATSFGAAAVLAKWPIGTANGSVSVVVRRAQVGAPYLSRQISFLFGGVIPVPDTDEHGILLTNIAKEQYWLPEPYTTTGHTNDSYYWSPNAGKVYAIQAGPLSVTWKKASSVVAPPADYVTNSPNYLVSGGHYFRLFTETYIISGSPAKPPRKIYWTEKNYQRTGKLVGVPSDRVRGGVNIVYNNNFPRTVGSEYTGIGQSSAAEGSTNASLQEFRTLWHEHGNLHAYNQEGRVFVELLGDARPDGQTHEQLGYEIVDVYKQVNPFDLQIELGERITPPPPGSLTNLFPQPIVQSGGLTFALTHNRPGSAIDELYATRETEYLNDFTVHWMERGEIGLLWPSLLARYKLVWPADVSKYSQFVRHAAATEAEAAQTAVPLPTDNIPTIDYQDPLDEPRAKLTGDFKFYTFLTEDYPAHRTLLHYTAGANIAFERVFSWLDTALETTNFASSVAANLSAWNAANRSMTWPDEGTAPRVVRQTAVVGQRITAPSGEAGSGAASPYLPGYINQSGGLLFNPGAYADPFTNAPLAAAGAIIPVNAVPGSNTLEVWWFRTNRADNLAGFKPALWPSVIGLYTIQWPSSALEIVMANNSGSAAVEQNPLVALGRIYSQNDRSLPGYNPNEEHALMIGGSAYALRDDLNITAGENYSSEPFVLVDYLEADGRPAMRAYKALREKPEAGWQFDYLARAGSLLQAPMPLPLLEQPIQGAGGRAVNYNRENNDGGGDLPAGWSPRDSDGAYSRYDRFTFEDRKHGFWVYRGPHQGLPPLEAGQFTGGGFITPVMETTGGAPFTNYIHASRQLENLSLALSGAPPWLSAQGMAIVGRPPASTAHGDNPFSAIVSSKHDGSAVTLQLNARIVPPRPGLPVAQGPLRIVSTNVYAGGATNVFTDRAPFLAASPNPTNSFTMSFGYKNQAAFDWPGLASPPAVGAVVPYLRPLENGAYSGTGADDSAPLQIVYRPYWPEVDPLDETQPLPTLPYGQTLTEPVRGLPGVRGFKTAEILYQQSIATNIALASVSAVLHDPTRQKTSDLVAAGLSALPAGVAAQSYQGRVYFPNLPPHLATRVFFDPNTGAQGSLGLAGQFVDDLSEPHLFLNVLRGSDLDAVLALCPASDPDYSKWRALALGLSTSVQTFHENPDAPGTYIPKSSVSVGVQDVAVITDGNTAKDSYALSAVGPGGGYITLVEGNGAAFTQPGDPVALHIIKVGSGLYPGSVRAVKSPNPLSEEIVLQHTGDFAGRFDAFQYEWKKAQPVDGAPPAADTGGMSNYLAAAAGTNLPTYLIGGAGVEALADLYLVMRYSPADPAHPLYGSWSEWTAPALAEGWIKRVLAGINPFNQRTSDLFNNTVSTDASILAQAGPRWEGDVALNADTLNSHGLIEIYETVLRRGRALSIEAGINDGAANDALLLAAGYLSDLYQMLGNEAWADAGNPTIGIGSKDSAYGEIATALFSFKGQEPSLLEEELALLRGRDDSLQPGVQIAPFYNRLVWNYTRGINSGEVIYALNYDIDDQNQDGVVDAADAALLYPQAHGDSYGHYLTAVKGYYSLLMNPHFTWVPRIEAVTVAGQAVAVDYLDERKFAAAAASVARTGREALDLTWRRDYSPGVLGWDHLSAVRVNPARTNNNVRYWGVDHWAARTGQGAYLGWVVGNSILPPIDPNPLHEGIQKVDRTTVLELQELPAEAQALQVNLDNAEGGLTPLGLAEGSLAFDLNPNDIAGSGSKSHFEQVYSRAAATLVNAVAAFDDAKDVTRLMRSEQDSVEQLKLGVRQQEIAYTNALIELYGSPYPDDVGPGKTYPQGYAGPDLAHFAYVDSPQLTFASLLAPNEPKTFRVDLQSYSAAYDASPAKNFFNFIVPALANGGYGQNTNLFVEFTLDAYGNYLKPASWSSRRASPGALQAAISAILSARNSALEVFEDNQALKRALDRQIDTFNAKLAVDQKVHGNDFALATAKSGIALAEFAATMYGKYQEKFGRTLDQAAHAAIEAIPKNLIVGMAVGGDETSIARAIILAENATVRGALRTSSLLGETAIGLLKLAKDDAIKLNNVLNNEPAMRDLENRVLVRELDAALSDLQGSLFPLNQRLQELEDALDNYRRLVAQGDRLLQEREAFRQRSAALVQGYRTRDAAFRLFRNEKLERYKTLFDLASLYAYLAANAYDYETGLLGREEGMQFLQRVINARSLGVVRNGQPQYAGSDAGDPGLSGALAEMKADWDVLRGRLGFNNPDAYGTTASLRVENFRVLPGTNGLANWQNVLRQSRRENLLDDSDIRRYCMQMDGGDGLSQPGLVLEFSTTISAGHNLFGQPLAPGDHAYSPSSFATKLFGVGVAFEGYRGMDSPSANTSGVGGAGGSSPPDPNSWFLDPLGLSANPHVYLVPVGADAMRSPPLGDLGTVRSWMVNDVAIPLPFNIGASDFSEEEMYLSGDSLSEPLFTIRKHQAFRPVPSASFFSPSLYGQAGTLQRSQYTNNRLVARSVWNTKWKLVIPGGTLLHDPVEGLDRFIQTVSDVKIHFVTYSYSGN